MADKNSKSWFQKTFPNSPFSRDRGTISNPRVVWGIPENQHVIQIKDPSNWPKGNIPGIEIVQNRGRLAPMMNTRSRVNLGAGAPSRGGGSRNPPRPATKFRGGGMAKKRKK